VVLKEGWDFETKFSIIINDLIKQIKGKKGHSKVPTTKIIGVVYAKLVDNRLWACASRWALVFGMRVV